MPETGLVKPGAWRRPSPWVSTRGSDLRRSIDVRQILRVIVALFAVAALTGGGAVAFADHGSGGSSGSGEEQSGHHDGGEDNAGHDAGDDNGANRQAGDDRKDDARGPGKDDHGDD